MGLASGIAPGPLLSLVISETLRGNRLNGILIAIAPLITDLPIIVGSILLLDSLSTNSAILGIMSIFGGVFLIYIGYKNLRSKITSSDKKTDYKTSIKYGILTNILSPHPYLFWITVGAPTFIKATKTDISFGYLFIISFYLLFFGSKIGIAVLTGFFNSIITGKVYKNLIKVLGIIIMIFAFVMIYDGIDLILQ